MKLSLRSVKNYRNALATLFSFAESRGWILKGGNPVDDAEKVTGDGDSPIEIFTPKEAALLLASAPPDFLPLMALGAFAGLRSAEALRLEWSDIDLAGGFITVASDKSKTRSRRLVPIAPNLAQWLAPYARRSGKVWTGSDRDFKGCRRDMLANSGVKWKDNGLRHSYISYRVAEIQDAARVSLEAGNSPPMIFRHYRELVKPADAERWFAVKPETPANVLPLAAVAAA
jgi:integrase